jgi:glucose/arabinose dehydrogenase
MRGVYVVIALAGCYETRSSHGGGAISEPVAKQAQTAEPSPYDIVVPPGFRVELVADHLTYPTGIAFSEKGRIFVVESGYSYGEDFATARLLEIVDGQPRELASGDHAPWTGVAYKDGALYIAEGGEQEGGRIVRFDLATGAQTVLVDNLPSLGDHHTNGPVVSNDGWVYFGQGTATNSGIVGADNQQYGWLARHPELHDIPCRDVTLAGVNFDGTGAYLPAGTPSESGQVIKGQVPCSGAIMRVKTTGGPVELVAWGFRNPFGLALDRGTLYATDNGYDMRGSRPVFGSADVLWKVEPSHWYGWPDYSEGRPLTASFYSEGDGKPRGFVLAAHPETPPHPKAYLPVHSSADGLDFSHGETFGYPGWAFIALFGDMAPTAGKVLAPVGFEIVRVDPRTGDIAEFARNRGDKPGPASLKHQRGLERPIAVRFDPSGSALYVVDFGVIRMTDAGPQPERESGRIWKIVKEARYAGD